MAAGACLPLSRWVWREGVSGRQWKTGLPVGKAVAGSDGDSLNDVPSIWRLKRSACGLFGRGLEWGVDRPLFSTDARQRQGMWLRRCVGERVSGQATTQRRAMSVKS